MEDITILYEDNHLLVAVKPQNILSQGDKTQDKDFLTMLKEYLKEKTGKTGNVYLGLVHRLDRPTGGVMVFAKTSKCAERLAKQMIDKKFEKRYLAVTDVPVAIKMQRLENYLKKDGKTNIVKVCPMSEKDAKKAVTVYKEISSNANHSLLDVQIETGRSHQIRVQLANIKCPLFGDNKYGAKGKTENLALWAYKLCFFHPTKNTLMKFCAMPPQTSPWTEFNLDKTDWK